MTRLLRNTNRLLHFRASFIRTILLGIIMSILLAMAILVPPASGPVRSRLHHYHLGEMMRYKERGRETEVLAYDASGAKCRDGACDVVDLDGGDRVMELTVFIVFHHRLYERLYEGIVWTSLLPSLSTPTTSAAATTRDIVNDINVYHQEFGRQNGNRIFFVATRDLLGGWAHIPKAMRGRVLREWEMPGFTADTSFLHIYSVMLSVYCSGLVGSSPGNKTLNAPGPAAPAAIDDAWVTFLEYDMRIDEQLLRRIRRRILQRPQAGFLRCCIFYGESYNTFFLLDNELGLQLLAEYNRFFHTTFSLKDLPSVSATGAIVVPSALFYRIAPFLQAVAQLLAGNRSSHRGTPTTMAPGGLGTGMGSAPLEVMEAALALSLGLEARYMRVEVPIRHLTGGELEELDASLRVV